MASLICVFAMFVICLDLISLRNGRSYWFRFDFLVILSGTISLKANDFKTFEFIWFKKFDWFLSFASLFLLFVNLLPSLIKEQSHLLCS